MLRRYSLLAILVLTALLAGCAPKAAVPPAEVRALENPTTTTPVEQPASIVSPTKEVVPHDPPASCPITVSYADAELSFVVWVAP
jgi:hypothetical protein